MIDQAIVSKGLASRQLMLRIVSALIMAPIALAAVYGGGFWLASLVLVVGVVGTYEWNTLSGVKTTALTALNGLVFIAALGAYQWEYRIESAIIIIAGAALCGITSRFNDKSIHWPIWGQLYIGMAIISIMWLRDVYGWQAVIWLLTIIWAMDIGAYFFGSAIGGPKLAPKASPNKTWAGMIGGALSACLFSWLAAQYFNVASVAVALIAGLGLALWSQIGDIVESMIKRHFNVKDSGATIPGHGGVLDRIDSLLFTLPVLVIALYFWPDFLLRQEF